MDAREQVKKLLKEVGAEFIRRTGEGHLLYKLPNGEQHSTPSPHRGLNPKSWHVNLQALRKRLGTNPAHSLSSRQLPNLKVRRKAPRPKQDTNLASIAEHIPQTTTKVLTMRERIIAAAKEGNELEVARLRAEQRAARIAKRAKEKEYHDLINEPRHGEVVRFGAAQVAAANYIRNHYGEDAYRTFLVNKDLKNFKLTIVEDPLEIIHKLQEKKVRILEHREMLVKQAADLQAETDKKILALKADMDRCRQEAHFIEEELNKPLHKVDQNKLIELLGKDSVIQQDDKKEGRVVKNKGLRQKLLSYLTTDPIDQDILLKEMQRSFPSLTLHLLQPSLYSMQSAGLAKREGDKWKKIAANGHAVHGDDEDDAQDSVHRNSLHVAAS